MRINKYLNDSDKLVKQLTNDPAVLAKFQELLINLYFDAKEEAYDQIKIVIDKYRI